MVAWVEQVCASRRRDAQSGAAGCRKLAVAIAGPNSPGPTLNAWTLSPRRLGQHAASVSSRPLQRRQPDPGHVRNTHVHLRAASTAIVVDVFPTPLDVPAITTVRGQAASLLATIRAARVKCWPCACRRSALGSWRPCHTTRNSLTRLKRDRLSQGVQHLLPEGFCHACTLCKQLLWASWCSFTALPSKHCRLSSAGWIYLPTGTKQSIFTSQAPGSEHGGLPLVLSPARVVAPACSAFGALEPACLYYSLPWRDENIADDTVI